MSISKNEYVIVNLWTSKKNEALTGFNCGHVSLTVVVDEEETYISFWPGEHKPYKLDPQGENQSGFFQKKEVGFRKCVSNFVERPTSYNQDYQEDCLLEAVSENKYRDIKDINDCLPGETAYRVHTTDNTYVRLFNQPRGIKEEEVLRAVKLLPANFRMILYSINARQVLAEFNRLRQHDCVTGWTMAGSNLLTRNLKNGETNENCASLAYRCLNAGGLFNNISSKLSLQPSSAVAPDDLLRIIVAAKIKELGRYTGDRDAWRVQGVDESSLVAVKDAYAQVKQNANAEDDMFPSLKPSVSTCTLF